MTLIQRPFCVAASLAILIVTAGCGVGSNKQETDHSTPKSLEPVTLKLYDVQGFTDDDFAKLFTEPVRKKYPHITVEKIAKTNNPLANAITSGAQLDIVTLWHGGLPSQNQLEFLEDISPLLKKHNFDLGRFDPKAIDAVRLVSNGGLYGLPYNVNFNALYYNLDIFDRFGIAYPKDGMNWEETIELGRTLTRMDAGVQYRGLDADGLIRLSFPLSLNVVNPKTEKADVNNDLTKRVFELGKRINDIPGNEQKGNFLDVFRKDRTIAMLATSNFVAYFNENKELKWDLAQYPSYPDRVNTYGMYDLHVMAVSKTSKNKDDAFRVLEVLLSDDVQMTSAGSTGRLSPLKGQKFQDHFGSEHPLMKTKNLKSIFKSKPADAPSFSRYYLTSRTLLDVEYKNYLANKKDVNTALRDAEEAINKDIKTQQGN